MGEDLTIADERQFWSEIRKSQEKILKDKKINHRNFGVYSKHICGYEAAQKQSRKYHNRREDVERYKDSTPVSIPKVYQLRPDCKPYKIVEWDLKVGAHTQP